MGLPSYVINFDELNEMLKEYLQNGINVNIAGLTFSTAELERLLQEISGKIQGVNYNDLITALNTLGVKLDSLASNFGITGIQKVYGSMLEVPPTLGPHLIEFTVPSIGKVTGITCSQSAWSFQDTWSLEVGATNLFDKVRTKEYGEYKHFNAFYPVASGQVIKFIFNNESSSSKIVWIDFHILEG